MVSFIRARGFVPAQRPSVANDGAAKIDLRNLRADDDPNYAKVRLAVKESFQCFCYGKDQECAVREERGNS